MAVVLTLAGDRTLAPDVQCAHGIQLPSVGHADNHAELLLHVGIRRGGVHAPELQRRPLVLVHIRQQLRSSHRLCGEPQRLLCADSPPRFRDRPTIRGHQHTGNSVISPCPVDIPLHHLHARYVACLDGRVKLVDGGFFKLEGLLVGGHAVLLMRPRYSKGSGAGWDTN